MTAANHYTPAESERRGAAGEQAADEKILRKDDGGIEGEQGGSSCVGAFCTMLTVSSAIDPLGGEMVRQDRSVPVVTGNTFIKE